MDDLPNAVGAFATEAGLGPADLALMLSTVNKYRIHGSLVASINAARLAGDDFADFLSSWVGDNRQFWRQLSQGHFGEDA
jgi:hypothetical protein